jgi:hypothetical protein
VKPEPFVSWLWRLVQWAACAAVLVTDEPPPRRYVPPPVPSPEELLRWYDLDFRDEARRWAVRRERELRRERMREADEPFGWAPPIVPPL